ncbi:unnamed protein product, partial [Rhizoctonia solani]
MNQPTIRKGRSSRPSAYNQIGTRKKITVHGRRLAPTSVEESSEAPSLLKAKPMRLTKSKLMKLSERDRARDALLTKDKLSRQQQASLSMLQQQINAAELGDVAEEAMYDSVDNNWVDINEETECNGEATQESEVIEELGVRTGNTEWANRLSAEDHTWKRQIEDLCDAFLEYCSARNDSSQKNHEGAPATQEQTISLQCISLKEETENTFSIDSDSCVQSLVLHGYLSSTPIRPTVAFSLDVLELADTLQRRSPSTSIQGIAETLCDLRNVPYKRYHRVQLSSALDVYRMICREAKNRLDVILSHASHGRSLKNCCTPCTYKLRDEPRLKYAMMVTGDGNNSLKRCSRAAMVDKRQYKSEYYITRPEVDAFKNEVKSSQKSQEDSDSSECEHRWKNASADKRTNKLSKNFFEETGIFTSTCRHSIVLTICDMVRTGEQAKYGLATIDRLLSTFGPRLLMGYDIGSTRLASPYHRHQRIHLFIETWNNNMYEGLGRLLRSKYINALKVIDSANNLLEQSSNTAKDYQDFFAEEKKYLVSAKHERPEDAFMINYVELLELMFSKQEELDTLNATSPDRNSQATNLHRATLVIEHQRRTVLDQLLNVQNAVKTIE